MKQGMYKATLNTLLPQGMVATKKWLSSKGLNTHTLDNAIKTNTLLLLTPGVYSQYSRNVCWKGIVASIQHMDSNANPSVHVGGITALLLSNVTSLSSTTLNDCAIHLYSLNPLPSWLFRLPITRTYIKHSVKSLWPPLIMESQQFLKPFTWCEGRPPVYYSCPEKAILEALVDVPNTLSFECADRIMGKLGRLSPHILDTLLATCQSIKVKRLFFWLSERSNHPWFKEIDVTRYHLGSGKRALAKHGMLHAGYAITIPRHMDNSLQRIVKHE